MISDTLAKLIDKADKFGLDAKSLSDCREYLQHREYGLCFDTLVEQLYEYNISIDSEFYDLTHDAATKMKLPDDDHSFMKELIK